MSNVFDESQTSFSLGGELKRGGEGVIWRIHGTAEYLVKIYHNRPDGQAIAKQKLLQTKAGALKDFAMMPVSLAFGDRGLQSHVGIFIPYAGGHEIHQLYGPRSRFQYFPNATFKFLVRAAYNLATAFEEIHNQGIVIGDVNEQNIKVQADATVRIIDCDSFQIRYGNRFYASNVGTPLWTAPELHGKNLAGLERARNHDQFGLAQLIFLLLFSGRFPFAGVPRTNRYLQPEEAIREHAFAFAPDYMNIPLKPPPGCPELKVLPPALQKAFLQSFLSDSVRPDGRPSAGEWRRLLASLSNELVACQHNSSHHFWKGATSCPWCDVAKEVGMDLFPPNASAIFSYEPASSSSYRVAPIPHAFSISTPPITTGLQPSPLPPQPSGFVKGLYNMFSSKGWKTSWLKPHLHGLRQAIQVAEAQISKLQVDQRSLISTYNRDFSSLASRLKAVFDDLNRPAIVFERHLNEYSKVRRESELLVFLRGIFIRNHSITQIGPVREATLISFGIETAAEITITAVQRANMPSNAAVELLSWRKSCEARFKFDPARSLTQGQLDEVKRSALQTLANHRPEASALEVKINALTSTTNQQMREFEAGIRQRAKQRDQAKLDIEMCERELNKP